MSAVTLPGWQGAMLAAFEAAGHTVAVRINRLGNRKASLDGGRDMDIGPALRRIETVMTAEQSWPWMRNGSA